MARLFIAVWPPAEVARALTGMQRGDQHGVSFVRPQNWHITLRFVGHLTLARVKSHAAMPQAVGSRLSAEFDVEEVALVQSRLDPRGVQYETIERWPVG